MSTSLTATPSESAAYWLRGAVPPEMLARVITQDELRRLRDLREFVREHSQLRDTIKAKVLANAPLEAGTLDLQVTPTTQRSFSYEKLAHLLGEQEADRLKEQIEPTISYRMEVIDL
ncbi:MAG: hypothetical protein H6822_24100 [Planctomycetaceae bacterium]|nr:hypothetical protein [Planctomycetales bacterium]MCB9925282.1 hypothetical protein [Planctomycetaceae bacterium]